MVSENQSDSSADGGQSTHVVEFDPSSLKLLVIDNEAAHARAMMESLEKVGTRVK